MNILNKKSNEIQRIAVLKNNRNKRHRYQEFVVEGRVAIDEAFKKGWKIQSIFYDKDRPLSSWAKQHLESRMYEKAYAVSSKIMDDLSDRLESSELIVIAKQVVREFNSYQPGLSDVVVLLDEPKSPGNMGMMIRSAVAFGASAILISGHGADEYDPQCIRASVGTFFSIPIYRVSGVGAFMEKLETWRATCSVSLIASGNEGAVSLGALHFDSSPLFLILGNETSGVSRGYQEIADQFVHIPLQGEFTSLNIAAAGSIFLYEIFRQHKLFL